MSHLSFSLLTELYPAPALAELLSAERTVQGWIDFEHALAAAQAVTGVISEADAQAISSVTLEHLDLPTLWTAARNVGYPILPLVRQMAAHLPEGPNGRVHYGATTQDAMDTGQALMLRDTAEALEQLVEAVGERLTALVGEHASTVMPGRTHGQQAVPTTFGAHLAPVLAELTRSRRRLAAAKDDVSVISLFGAGGTSAALGAQASALRRLMAQDLGLYTTDVPWHTARDGVVTMAQTCTLLVGSCARLARNVIDLSRTEIGEIHEAAGSHRGASSTMPQKANPILAEGIIGMSAIVGPLVSSLSRTLEMPQERAAGEWQIEWHVLPQILQLTGSVLTAAAELLEGLRVSTTAMRSNLAADGGLIMSEAAMISLADALGREQAHDIVYGAALDVRSEGSSLGEAVRNRLEKEGVDADVAVPEAAEYLGEAGSICEAARRGWAERAGGVR